MENIDEYVNLAQDLIVDYGLQLIGAVLTLLIGLWVLKGINRAFSKLLERREIDPSLVPFLKGLVSTSLKAFLIIAVLGMLGIEMTSFIAILGAAGLAVGMALSGTLSNFAGGVVILILKPFKVGDFIEAQGYSGTVNAIQIFYTVLKTPDNKTIIIPNGPISTGSLINYSTEAKRRVDWSVGIGYGDNIDQARSILMEILQNDERIKKDPPIFIKVEALADSSVNLATRVWVDAPDFWDVKMETMEKIYNEFNAKGINIPFPQMDVHLHKEKD